MKNIFALRQAFVRCNHGQAGHSADMEEMVPIILDKPADEVRHRLEMLVRAYDPCISCSTH